MDGRRRVLTPQELMPEYERLLREGAELPLTVTGSSMCPFLSPQRDTVYLKGIDRELKKGDIVFFRRNDGSYVLHRLCGADESGLYLAGDAQDTVEGPIDRNAALAIAARVIRKGRELRPGDLRWDFFAHVWILTVGRRQKIFIPICNKTI